MTELERFRQGQEPTQEEVKRGEELTSRFIFRRLSNNQKKALRPSLNQTQLWANAGVD